MSSKYKFNDPDELYFVSFAVVNWIDLFIRNIYKDILLDSWRHCQKEKGMELYGWCIMTSHVHMIIGSQKEMMEDIPMKRFADAGEIAAVAAFIASPAASYVNGVSIRVDGGRTGSI